MNANKRRLFKLLGGALALPGWSLGKEIKPPLAAAESVDVIMDRLRALDLSPAWFTSANWANGAYDPWTDYVSGRMSEEGFSRVCSLVTDYCLRDVWNLRKPAPDSIDWSSAPINWNGIHALALRYYRTGLAVYLQKWLAVVLDYAVWAERERAAGRHPTRDGQPAALLDAAFTWGGIHTALAIAAKGLGAPSGHNVATASPYDPLMAPLPASQAALIPQEVLTAVSASFAQGAGTDLVRFHAQPRYVPNQRMFGLEAVAQACAFFPAGLPASRLRRALDEGISDVASRYTQLDGGQLEQSFNYAQDLVSGLMRVLKLPLVPEPPWRRAAIDTTTGWQRFTQAIALPAGGLPQLGNAAAGRVAPSGTGARFAASSMAFPYSGIYSQRSDWSGDACHLVFFTRRVARGHSMAGSNSVQVHAFGRSLLGAGGSADYRPTTDANRSSATYLHEASTWKTSTVLVDGLSQRAGSAEGLALDDRGLPDHTRAPLLPIKARWYTSEALDYVEGHHTTGYQRTLTGDTRTVIHDVAHWRQVIFVRPMMLWIVVDVMRTAASHAYTQVWKFAPPGLAGALGGFRSDEVIASEGDGAIRTAKASKDAVNVALHQFSPATLSHRKYFASDGFGYHSSGPLSEAVPAVDVHTAWAGQGSQVCLTAIAPYRGPQSTLVSVNRSRLATAACELVNEGGVRLEALATASPAMLSAGALQAPDADLLLALHVPGRVPVHLVISASGSHVIDKTGRVEITAPSTFRWIETASRALVPRYHT